MKIQILSDLHFEFYNGREHTFVDSLNPEGVDVLCLAGDIGTVGNLGDSLLRGLKLLCDKYPQVVMVAGNHEYYSSSKEKVRSALEGFEGSHPSFHWLENGSVQIGEQRFIGCTLWFDNDPNAIGLRSRLNDFNTIKDFTKWNFQAYQESKDFLRKNIKRGDVVITHHLPSYSSCDKSFRSGPMDSFYASNMDNIVLESEAKMWIHGHTHCSQDYQMGATRIICNPFGYFNHAQNRKFNKKLVVEI